MRQKVLIFAEMCVNLQPNCDKRDFKLNEKIYFYALHNAGMRSAHHFMPER